jgi:hypothetical protein
MRELLRFVSATGSPTKNILIIGEIRKKHAALVVNKYIRFYSLFIRKENLHINSIKRRLGVLSNGGSLNDAYKSQ